MILFDSHAHLDVAEFDADRGAMFERARGVDVQEFLVPAIDASHWPGLATLQAAQPGVHAAYGIHPMYLDNDVDAALDALPDWIEAHPTAAIGECGLDYYVEGIDGPLQQRAFRRQLEIAREFDLPVIVHARRAVEAVVGEVRALGGLRGIIHSYPGSYEQAKQLHKLGFLIGIGGPVTYERANRLRRLVARAPLEWMVLETDSPDQPGAAQRGQRNEPMYLREVLRCVAELRGADETSIAEQTTANMRALLRLGSDAAARPNR